MAAAIFICAMALAIDGDTLRCANVAQAEGRVRLARIDAPERSEPTGPRATTALRTMLSGPVTCRHVDADPRFHGFQALDRYGRIVAFCSVAGRDLSQAMLSSGNAQPWPLKRHR